MSFSEVLRRITALVLFASFVVAVKAQTFGVDGKVTATVGQRIEIQFADGSKQWFSVMNADALIESSLVGKRVVGTAVKRGDTVVLQSPVFRSQ